MISMSRPTGAGQAASYFEKADYYTQEPGQWYGKGAEELGLKGDIAQKDFMAVCAGLDPNTSLPLVQTKTDPETGELKHIAGVDMTFSLPKSASLYSLGDQKTINEIFDTVNKRVLDFIEQNLIQGRMVDPETGKQISANTGNMIVGRFSHMTSRENEPQRHDHNFIVSMTQRADGTMVAVHNPALYKAQRALGRMQDNEMVHELRKAGFEVEITDREKGNWELTGVSKELIDAHSTRHQQIEAKTKELKAIPDYRDKTDAEIRELANLSTRKAKEEKSADELKGQWDHSFAECGETMESVADKVNELRAQNLEKRAVDKANGIDAQEVADKEIEHVTEALDRGAQILTDAESAFSLTGLLNDSIKGAFGEHSLKSYLEVIPQQFLKLDDKAIDDKGTRESRLTTHEMIKKEAWVMQRTKEVNNTFKSPITRERVEEFLNRIEAHKSSDLTEQLVSEGKLKAGETAIYAYTPSQRECVKEVLCGTDGVLINQGDPGTGKTTIRELVEIFNKELMANGETQHYVLGAGFTKRAAAELVENGVINAKTIDSFLNHKFEVVDTKGEIIQDSPNVIKIPRDARLEILVDEASMMGTKHTEAFMRRADELREMGFPVKTTLSGDNKQLPAISAGKMFDAITASNITKTVFLKDINRQKTKDTLEIANLLNNNMQTDKAVDILKSTGHLHELTTIKKKIELAVDKYFDYTTGENAKCTAFIATPYNADRIAINEQVHNRRVANGEIEKGQTIEVLASAGVSGSARVAANNYKAGQVIDSFKGLGEVVDINTAQNTITARYQKDNGRPYLYEHNLKKHHRNIQVYNREQREMSVGDTGVFLKNSKNLGVENGTMFKIKAIDGDNLTVTLDKAHVAIDSKSGEKKTEKTTDITFNSKEHPYFDHGYAGSVHKSQGASFDKVVAVFSKLSDFTSYQMLNVAMTRMKTTLDVICSSETELKEALKHVQDKETTLQLKKEVEPAAHGKAEATIKNEKTSEHNGQQIFADVAIKTVKNNVLIEGKDISGKTMMIDTDRNKIADLTGLMLKNGKVEQSLVNIRDYKFEALVAAKVGIKLDAEVKTSIKEVAQKSLADRAEDKKLLNREVMRLTANYAVENGLVSEKQVQHIKERALEHAMQQTGVQHVATLANSGNINVVSMSDKGIDQKTIRNDKVNPLPREEKAEKPLPLKDVIQIKSTDGRKMELQSARILDLTGIYKPDHRGAGKFKTAEENKHLANAADRRVKDLGADDKTKAAGEVHLAKIQEIKASFNNIPGKHNPSSVAGRKERNALDNEKNAAVTAYARENGLISKADQDQARHHAVKSTLKEFKADHLIEKSDKENLATVHSTKGSVTANVWDIKINAIGQGKDFWQQANEAFKKGKSTPPAEKGLKNDISKTDAPNRGPGMTKHSDDGFSTSLERNQGKDLPQFSKGLERGVGPVHNLAANGVGFQWEKQGLFKAGDRSFIRGHAENYDGYDLRINKQTRYIQTGENKGSVINSRSKTIGAHTSKDETISRADGSKIDAKSYSYRVGGGYLTLSHTTRTEMVKDKNGNKLGTKTSTTKTIGGIVSGTTRTVGKDGTISVTKWSGHLTMTGKMKIDKSKTTTIRDQKIANRELVSLPQRMVRAFAERLARNAFNKETAKNQKILDFRNSFKRVLDPVENKKDGGSLVKSVSTQEGAKFTKTHTITRKDGTVIKSVEKGEQHRGSKHSVRVETVEKGENRGDKKIIETHEAGRLRFTKVKCVSTFGKIRETESLSERQADGSYKMLDRPHKTERMDIGEATKILFTDREKILSAILKATDKIKAQIGAIFSSKEVAKGEPDVMKTTSDGKEMNNKDKGKGGKGLSL